MYTQTVNNSMSMNKRKKPCGTPSIATFFANRIRLGRSMSTNLSKSKPSSSSDAADNVGCTSDCWVKWDGVTKDMQDILGATVNGGNGNWKRNSETGNGSQFYNIQGKCRK